ncbi:DnaJ domain-containing protein [Marivirga harenae]|uniref:J domain-containing protein n=1 Tax=Marivirga harenae TaxID=2010992 RepID=UPI0026DF3573|nr:DnaJ domain-containing protein [Marivirga harenae]WKV13271.1 DnaJ domain-containing protein [Marivirga harenae]|tara:strand:- start:85586 stop:86398 length:813 start_codon:yes stop_codon:yes gene_type:complete
MASSKRTYIESISILGLNAGASQQEIKESYRNLAKQYHPDIYKIDGGAKFKEINSAYRFLKRYPDPPTQDENESVHSNSQKDYERRKRAYHQRQKSKKAKAQKDEMFKWLFVRLKLFVFIILVFNILLLIDFCLPKVSEPVKIDEIETVKAFSRYGSGTTKPNTDYIYRAELNNGMTFRFGKEEIAKIEIDDTLVLKRSMIFKQGDFLTNNKKTVTIYSEYSVFRVFGFLIPTTILILLAYLYYVKNNEYRLTIFLIAALIFLIQFVLLL